MTALLDGRRLVIVHNPHSSRADEVNKNVFTRLDTAGYQYTTLEVRQASLADNIAALSPRIQDGDVIISAAGDGSAHAVSQAVMAADKKNVTVGFLAYGNFNDVSHTFNSRNCLKDPVALLKNAHQEVVYPLIINADDQYVRQALLYVTIGWTAQAAAQFDKPDIRRLYEKQSVSLVRTLLKLGSYYFRSRRKSYLPPFTVGRKSFTHRTDIIFANGPSVARLFHTGTDYYKTSEFLLRILNVSSLLSNSAFLVSGLFGYMSGKKSHDTLITFKQPESIPAQCDGEVIRIEGVTHLRIKKSEVPFYVLSTK